MKTYKLKEFLQLPVGTIFYVSLVLGRNICIKEDSIIENDYLDFYFMEIFNSTDEVKKQRYGSPELDDEFDVLEKEDLLLLKSYIDNALIVKGLEVND